MRRLLKPKLKHVFAAVYTGECCYCFENTRSYSYVYDGQEVVQAMLPFSVTFNAIVYGGRKHTMDQFSFLFFRVPIEFAYRAISLTRSAGMQI